ncbi:MAG: cobalt ECF transporter T component CbiQ [candidate division Zixibacteria bacterium]|nr:cobalt ECF transporter T component CbiQ [candidate division Zixibacteria bacterium]
MRHDFIDKYAEINSPVHRLEPRIKILAALVAVALVTSEPKGELFAFLFYFAVLGAVVSQSRVPVVYVLKRLLIVSPFIIAAGLLLPLSYLMTGEDISGNISKFFLWPLSIVLKALAALLILTILTSTARVHELLAALRGFKMPAVFGVVSALMYRYIFILYDEMLRTNRARRSRTVGRGSSGTVAVYGNQAAMVFIRSFERSRAVYRAMLARGFEGEFPLRKQKKFTFTGAAITALFILCLGLIRIFL